MQPHVDTSVSLPTLWQTEGRRGAGEGLVRGWTRRLLLKYLPTQHITCCWVQLARAYGFYRPYMIRVQRAKIQATTAQNICIFIYGSYGVQLEVVHLFKLISKQAIKEKLHCRFGFTIAVSTKNNGTTKGLHNNMVLY